jgi:ComF family protein
VTVPGLAPVVTPLAPPATGAVFAYAFPVDALIKGLKFAGKIEYAEPLGLLLAASLAVDGWAAGATDWILPMPLSAQRLGERGYNQATEIARVLGRELGCPLAPFAAASRVRDTAPQTGLSRQARRLNVRGAFAAQTAVRGRRLLLVDDVITTGATAAEIARVLLRAGAAAVRVVAVARA